MIAEQEQYEQLAELMMEELQQLWEAAGGADSAEGLEQMVQAWQRGMGARVMEALCQQAVMGWEQVQVPHCCGRRMDHHSRQARTVTTLVGTVRVRRRYYRCLRCGKSVYPADAWLGWRGGFSHRVQEAVAMQCAGLPYREATAILERLTGIAVSVHAAQEVVARWGQEELTPEPYAERLEGAVLVGIDGVTAHLEDGWRETKVATVCSWDRSAEKPEPEAVSYVADWQPAKEFVDTLWQEALARGVPTAAAVAVVGDGAPWVWDIASTLFPRAVQILDWYHLCEHLWEAGRTVHGEGSAETKALVEAWKTMVWEGRSEATEHHLRDLVLAGEDDSKNTLRRCADYLQTHQHRLRYHLFRAAGWPRGSGVVEGACKHLIDLRFKRKSTRWTKRGAQSVLRLRLDILNGRWETRCQHMRTAA